MIRTILARGRPAAVLLILLAAAAPLTAQEEPTMLQQQVMERERAFAATMADRDHGAFVTFLSEEAVFFGGVMLRGRDEVAEGWRPYYETPEPLFSWEPEQVEVLPSGTLAHSSGPVRDPEGNQVGTFNSVWRLEADGVWRVVFDKGCSCVEGGGPPD